MLLQKSAKRGNLIRSILRHLIVWLAIGMILFLMLYYLAGVKTAFQFILIMALTAPAPVYLHFWVFDRYYSKRKYWKYVLVSLVITAFFGLTAEWLFYVLRQNPDEYISGILIVLFIVICSTGFKFYGRIIHQQYRIQETELRHLGTELALLKSQINPHFFFNTLNNLYSLSLQKSDRVPEVIMKLSSLMRFVLDSSKTSVVPVQDEIEFISNYVSLEKLRLPADFDLKFAAPEISENQVVAPMILTSVVENCFKHGLIDTSPNAFISIKILFQNNELILHTDNRKSNDQVGTQKSESGFGLENLKRRLELLYPGKHDLEIQDSKNNYSVTLNVRL